MQLLQKTLIYAIGNFGAKGLNMLLVPLFAIYLTKAEIGEYDLTLVTTLLLIPLLSMQLSDALFRWLISEKKEIKRAIIITNIASFYMLSIILVIAVFFLLVYFFPEFITVSQLIFIISQMIFLSISQIARGLSYTHLYAFSGFLLSVLIVTLSLVGLKYYSIKVEGLLNVASFSYLITFLVIAIKIKFSSYLRRKLLSIRELKSYLKYSISLVPNALSWWGISMGARYLILFKLGISANGLYAISAKLPSMLTIITSFFTLAWQEDYIENSNTNRTTTIFRRYYTLLLSALYLLIPFSYLLLSTIVPPDFFESWKYTYFLFVAAAFQALSAFLGADYLKKKKTSKIFVTTTIAMVVTLIMSFLLIDRYGLYGVSFSTFIGMLTMFLIRAIDLKILKQRDVLKISLLVFISYLLNLSLLYEIHIMFVVLSGVLLFSFANKELLSLVIMKLQKGKKC